MARTYRRAYSPDKSHHRNAIPYKRSKPIVIRRGDVEITIEKDDRYQVIVLTFKTLSKCQKRTKESSPLWMLL